MMTFFEKFRQNTQILKSRVSVSNFKSRVSEFLMKSRSRLKILTRSRSRRLRSRLHHWQLLTGFSLLLQKGVRSLLENHFAMFSCQLVHGYLKLD